MSEWIPIDGATISPDEWYWVTIAGIVESKSGVEILAGRCEGILAVVPHEPKPELYVAPKPKRREWTIDPKASGHINVSEIIDGKHERGIGYSHHVREVLPGDPDPEVVTDVIKEMRTFNMALTPLLTRWADRLEGK